MFTIKLNEITSSGKGVSLLPAKTSFSVSITLSYTGNGCWDIDHSLSQLESQAQKEMGIKVDFHSMAQRNGELIGNIKRCIIEQTIRPVANILDEFELDREAVSGSPDASSIPMLLKDTGYKFSIPFRLGKNNQPDASVLLPALESCFRKVFYIDSGVEVLSAAQRSTIQTDGQAWLTTMAAQAGLIFPEVILDTTGATWADDDLQLKVAVSGGIEASYDLLVPVSDRGEPDHANVAALAQAITQRWVQKYKCPNQAQILSKVKESLEGPVDEYVRWIIQLELNVRQEFLKNVKGGLDTALIEADRVLKESEEFQKKLRKRFKSLAEVEADKAERGLSDFWYYVITSWEKITEGLEESLAKIEQGLAKLPGQVYEGVSAHADDIMKGLEFGFRAAGIVIEEAASLVIRDVINACIGAIGTPPKSSLVTLKLSKKVGDKIFKYNVKTPKSLEFAVDRFSAASIFSDDLHEYKDLAMNINKKILAAKANVYGKHSD